MKWVFIVIVVLMWAWMLTAVPDRADTPQEPCPVANTTLRCTR